MTAGLLGQPGSFNVVNYSGSYNQISPGLGIAALFNNGGFLKATLYSELGSGFNAYEFYIRAGTTF